jgi:hypothetical protein
MDCTEMASDLSQLLLEYYAHQLDPEPSFHCGGLRHILRVLSSSQQHMELLAVCLVEEGTDACSSAWLDEVEYSDDFEGPWIEELAGAVSGASDEHGVIVGDCELYDLALVDVCLSNVGLSLDVEQDYPALVGGQVETLVQRTP